MKLLDEITIDEFRMAKFKNDRSIVSESELRDLEIEYYDIAGLFKTEDFSRVTHINYLSTRNNSVEFFCKLQIEFLVEFKVPYSIGFDFIKKFGYNLKWNNNPIEFLSQIENIRRKEKKFVSQLEDAIKELRDYRLNSDNGGKEEVTIASFLNTLFYLRKCGLHFDNKLTSMEELAYMIKYQLEQNKKDEAKIQSIKNR